MLPNNERNDEYACCLAEELDKVTSPSRIHHLFRQYYLWTAQKLQRHILAHRNPDDAQNVTALVLSLLWHTSIGDSWIGPNSLEDAAGLAQYLQETSSELADHEQEATIELLCVMIRAIKTAQIGHPEFRIQPLIKASAKVFVQMNWAGLKAVRALKSLEKITGQDLCQDDVYALAGQVPPRSVK